MQNYLEGHPEAGVALEVLGEVDGALLLVRQQRRLELLTLEQGSQEDDLYLNIRRTLDDASVQGTDQNTQTLFIYL